MAIWMWPNSVRFDVSVSIHAMRTISLSVKIMRYDTVMVRRSVWWLDVRRAGLGTASVRLQLSMVQCAFCIGQKRKLIVADHQNHCIRMVDVKTQTVTTIAGDRKDRSRDGVGLDCGIENPDSLLIDRSSTAKPHHEQSVVYITASREIRRFDLKAREMTTLPLHPPGVFRPVAIDFTPSGHLIVRCWQSNATFLIDPISE